MMVYLIGAGPGDPGLLTLKGKAILERADTVIYDYLAGDELTALVRPDAERIYVGKQAGAHTLPQKDINRLLVEKAREGKIVARLKGGDPYIFGRGGEEAEALAEAGIPFEEVPGVSSAVAGPAYAGIPLTHRGCASSVTLITGHEDPSKPGSAHNWQALAATGGTLVFVMGMKNLPDICRNLIEAGLNPDTPAAIIRWGTTPRQRSLRSVVSALPAAAAAQGFTSPALIVIGKTAALDDSLNWFERRPLFGRSIVVTRAREQAGKLTARLQELGADVIECPTIEIRPPADFSSLDAALGRLSAYHWLLFTSVNGVRFFRERLLAQGGDARSLAGLKVAAIGPATAQALASFGIQADFVPPVYVAEEVAKGLAALGMQGKKALLVRAAAARDVLPADLRKAGAEVDVATAYETLPVAVRREEVLRRLEEGRLDCVTFGSSSTVKHFFALFPPDLFRDHPETQFACIGPITASTLGEYGLQCSIQPESYTLPALVEAVRQAFAPRGTGGGTSAPARA